MTDSPGTDDLTAYPRPNVAVDLALLTVLPPTDRRPGTLAVLVQDRRHSAGRSLPGRFLRKRQTVREAVMDVLRLKIGLAPLAVNPVLLRIFDDPNRDERGWTVSLAHSVTERFEFVSTARGELVPVDAAGSLATGERLIFDHDAIVREAVDAVRRRYERRPDPDHILGADLTLGELRQVHEAVLGEPLLRDTFNRRMREHLVPTEDTRTLGGRPGVVYQRRADRRDADSERRRLRLPRQRP